MTQIWCEAFKLRKSDFLSARRLMQNLAVQSGLTRSGPRIVKTVGLMLTLLCVSPRGHADALAQIYGEWGTNTQCARSLISPGGTKHATPFDIRESWLGHGGLWCRLSWMSSSRHSVTVVFLRWLTLFAVRMMRVTTESFLNSLMADSR